MHFIIFFQGPPLPCSVCHKTFPNRRYLSEHAKTHAGERRFHCVVCGANFALERYLRRHARIHSGEKPYRWDPFS